MEEVRDPFAELDTGSDKVTAHNPTNMPDTLEDVTDDEGKFSFGGIRAGQWTFRFDADGFHPSAEQFSIAGRARAKLEVRLTRATGQALLARSEKARGEVDAANQAFQAGDYAKAVELYRGVLEVAPEIREIHFNIGLSLDQIGDYEGAVEAYRKYLEDDPEDVDGILKLAIALNRTGKTDEALEYYEKTTELDPENGVAFFNKGLVLFQAQRMDDARAAFTRSLELDPTLAEVHFMLGHIHVSGGDSAAALESYETFVAADPDSPNAAAAREAIEQLKQQQ